jgi:uncharacterized protein
MITPTPLNKITLQMTKNCNLNCKYCYLGDREKAETEQISADNVLVVLAKLAQDCRNNKKIHITFHGGEPLLLREDVYREIFSFAKDLAERKGEEIFSFSIQSNLTLLTPNICKLFAENNVSIGTSIDGPKYIHDSQRVFSHNLGTHDLVMDKVSLARDHGLKVGALCLATKLSLGRHNEIYNFFKNECINFKTNSLFMSGSAQTNRRFLETTEEEYTNFLKEIFDLWYEDDPVIIIDNLFDLMGLIIKNKPSGSCSRFNCSSYHLTISPNGSCYTCGRTTQDDTFYLGNLIEGKISDLINSETFGYLAERSPDRIKECQDCSLAQLCGAGCMYEAYLKHGTIYAPDRNCSSFIDLYHHISSKIYNSLNIGDKYAETKSY